MRRAWYPRRLKSIPGDCFAFGSKIKPRVFHVKQMGGGAAECRQELRKSALLFLSPPSFLRPTLLQPLERMVFTEEAPRRVTPPRFMRLKGVKVYFTVVAYVFQQSPFFPGFSFQSWGGIMVLTGACHRCSTRVGTHDMT